MGDTEEWLERLHSITQTRIERNNRVRIAAAKRDWDELRRLSAEIVAGIMSAATDGPVNIGSDSQSFITKAENTIDMTKCERTPKPPWSTQKHEDLWSIFHPVVLRRELTASG